MSGIFTKTYYKTIVRTSGICITNRILLVRSAHLLETRPSRSGVAQGRPAALAPATQWTVERVHYASRMDVSRSCLQDSPSANGTKSLMTCTRIFCRLCVSNNSICSHRSLRRNWNLRLGSICLEGTRTLELPCNLGD